MPRENRRTRRPPLGLFAVFTASLAAVGCDPGPTPLPPAATRPVASGPVGKAVVRGTVTFKGTPPEPEEVDGARCHAGAGPIKVTPVVVGPGGGLEGVVVQLIYAQVLPPEPPRPPMVLDQVNCRYVPAVVALRTGQVLRVSSSDATLHNVHALSRDNPGSNFGMTAPGQTRDLTFARPERFDVKCDVHPWMTAHVYVFDHPFFAVTGADGKFELAGLPPGEYTVAFSHPFLGGREQRVDLTDRAVTVDVTFEKGKPNAE